MTLDELEAEHADYLAWLAEEELKPAPPSPKLNVIMKKGESRHVNVPEAGKAQLLALREGVCPTCGKTAGCYVFDNIMLFYCHQVQHHRFKETLNWS